MKSKDTFRLVLIGCSGLPLLFINAAWASLALKAYLLTTLLFGALLVPEYPPVRSGWFWKATLSIAVMHLLILVGLVAVSLEVPEVDELPRMMYGVLALVLVLEWRLSVRIIQLCEPNGE